MMEPLTKEDVKASIVALVAAKFAVSLKELETAFQRDVSHLTSYVQVQTLLAEMVMESTVEQRFFRTGGRPVQIYYFPLGTINAHLLQTEMSQRARYRPTNFEHLSSEEQWNWDKALGILDWRGDPQNPKP